MQKVSKRIVQFRIPILIIALILLIPSVIGYIRTRVNYDILVLSKTWMKKTLPD